MARAAIAVCALLLVGGLGWWLFASDERSELTPRSAAAAPVAPDTATVIAAAPAERSERALATEVSAAQPPVPADAVWVEVRVVDKATQQPVADAEAVWYDEVQYAVGRSLPVEQQQEWYRNPEQIAERHGWRGRSDRDGKLRVNLGKQSTSVYARAGTRFGSLHLNAAPPPEALRLLLAEDLTVRVHVTDAAGRDAAGVPLGLEAFDPERKGPETINGECRTDRSGMAAFLHVQGRQTFSWGKRRGEPVEQWLVRMGIPGHGMEPVLVDAQSPPVEPVEVRLPPTGRLKLRVTFDGTPPVGNLPFAMLAIHLGPKGSPQAWNGAWSEVLGTDGWARFRYVPLGKTWFTGLPSPGGWWDLEVTGPTVAEQEVEAAFELLDQVIGLTGRLLDVDGAPLAKQSITADFDAGFMSGGHQVHTDVHGRFTWILGRPLDPAARELKLQRLSFVRRQAGTTPLLVKVAPRDLVVGRNELGDLRFERGPLVVSGRIVFDTPGPANAHFQVQRLEDPDRAAGWNEVNGVQVAVQEDGRFEARGSVEPGRYRLWFPAHSHLRVDAVEFAVGATDLVINIRRGATLSVTCRLPTGLEQHSVQLRLQPVTAPAPEPEDGNPFRPRGSRLIGNAAGTIDGSSKYGWQAVVAGQYTLLVEGQGFAEPFATVPDVVVPVPEGGDPRLRDLDLRPSIDVLRVRVNASGPGDRRCFVFPLPQPEDRDWSGFTIWQNEAVLPVPRRPVDLLFARAGMRPVTRRAVTGSADVTLEPWPAVELHFPAAAALPAGATLHARVDLPASARQGELRYVVDSGIGPLDPLLQPQTLPAEVRDGVVTLQVGEGPMRLLVWVKVGERGHSTTLRQVTPNEVVAGPPVTVQLSADEIRAAVAAALQRAAEKK